MQWDLERKPTHRLLSEMHKRQREKDLLERKALRAKLKPKQTACDDPMDLNTAATEHLQDNSNGIGPTESCQDHRRQALPVSSKTC